MERTGGDRQVIKAEAELYGDEIRITVEANSQADVDSLNLLYEAFLSQRLKRGGFDSSTRFVVSVPKIPESRIPDSLV